MSLVYEWLLRFQGGPLGLFGPLLEIGLMAAVFYALLGFIRGTRGAGVMRGLVAVTMLMILGVVVVFHQLRLGNLTWLMEQLLATLGLGLVVIFQPEIRQALVRLGETFRLIGRPTASLEKEIADAAVLISKKGEVGALIVLERETPLEGYIDSGVRIDADLNAPMLRTIFTRNTPLHDGAAIVRNGRIIAANCLLPLSENVELCRGMGTRHRAALGLSEETDAVTVVVSEETGAISVTMNGRISRDLDYEGLRAFLRENVDLTGARQRAENAAAESRGGAEA